MLGFVMDESAKAGCVFTHNIESRDFRFYITCGIIQFGWDTSHLLYSCMLYIIKVLLYLRRGDL